MSTIDHRMNTKLIGVACHSARAIQDAIANEHMPCTSPLGGRTCIELAVAEGKQVNLQLKTCRPCQVRILSLELLAGIREMHRIAQWHEELRERESEPLRPAIALVRG